MFAAITETGLPEDLLTLVQRVREVQIGHEAVAGQAGGESGKRGELQLNLNSTTVGARGVYVYGGWWQLWQQLPLIVLMNFPCKSPNFHVIFPWRS